jgi:hypothetical protein
MDPSARRAQVWDDPAETATAFMIPVTVVGVKVVPVVPSPSGPDPQHFTWPFDRSAQVWLVPAEAAKTLVSPTERGIEEAVIAGFPLPSSPW